MNNQNTSSIFFLGALLGAVLVFLFYHPTYQGKSAQDWYNLYIDEQRKNVSLNQSLQKANDAQEQRDQQKKSLQACLDQTDADYHAQWAYACTKFGISDTGSNCTLPTYNANTLDNRLQQNKDNCFKQYPQN